MTVVAAYVAAGISGFMWTVAEMFGVGVLIVCVVAALAVVLSHLVDRIAP